MTVRQFLQGLLLLAVVFLVSGTTGDPDLWGHVKFGQDMIANGAVRLPDTYSFTSARPWVNHEWLAEVLMAGAFNLFGTTGLNLLRIAVFTCVLLLLWRASASLGDRRRLMMVAAGALGIYLRAHPIRPQIFSLLLFTALLFFLQRADEQRSWRPLAWIPVLMAAWVNLHGGWIVGLGYAGLWSLSRAIDRGARSAGPFVVVLVSAFVATLLNPYGWHMWSFLAETVHAERPLISDWLPLYRLSPALWTPWIVAAAVLAIAAARARSRADWINVFMAAALGAAAIRVSRLDAFFALAAVFTAIGIFAGREAAADVQEQRPLPALAMVFAACALAVLALDVPRIRTIQVPETLMPDANVAAYARDEKLTGNVLTWFDWGEYVIWHFGPRLKVSMDGRRETVYTSDVIDAHMRFYTQAGQWHYAEDLRPDFVWIPKQLPVVAELRQRGWVALCEGDLSILLSRRDAVRRCSTAPTAASRVFPEL